MPPTDWSELMMPSWMEGTPMKRVWLDAYIETGDANLAMEAVRRDPIYDQFFAGNRREDGSLIYDESTYLSVIESYEDSLLSVGVNPDRFSDKFGDMIAGYVSPQEFAGRVETMYERVLTAAPEIRNYYRDNFGMEMSRAGIVASFLDPDVGQAILDRRISMSEIGGEASRRGFDVNKFFASQLLKRGLSGDQSQAFFAAAAADIPILQVLAQRHGDPDDEFDLYDFTSVTLEQDPTMRRTVRRYLESERAGFTQGMAGLTTRQNQETGGLAGLAPR